MRDKEVFMKKFFVLSSWSRIAAIGSIFMVAFLAACGDDDSWSPSDADNSRSSSSVIPGSDLESSSAEKQGSSSFSSVILSSSDIRDCATCCASGVILCGEGSSDSRSSDSKGNSSSSNKEESSSSKVFVESSSSLDDFDWSLPKEAYLNPKIQYDSIVDVRDGQVYKTVKTEFQEWMAENLNYADSIKTPSLLGRSWCFNNIAANCAVTGRLYTWAAAIDSVALYDGGNGVDCGYGKVCSLPAKVQGICPEGWHLPTYDDWLILFGGKDNRRNEAIDLKSRTGWYGGCNGIDAVGFTAIPAGLRYHTGSFDNEGYYAYFWTSEQNSDYYAYRMFLDLSDSHLDFNNKHYGHSVRCIKD